MERQIAISYPETLAFSLRMQNSEFEQEIKLLSLIKLYELGRISSGMAARTLGISRITFLDMLAGYGVSMLAGAEELESDFANA
ncbi:MAG: UPF0175 family protein [Spirochaetaceae bacterium]|jgi:predicted HTH domain antitoxin|nr:UPF0175 family protein [Spirochaetaceae bacterium]